MKEDMKLNVIEASHRDEYGEAHGYQGNDNNGYEGHQEGYGRDHERMIKTTSDRFEGGILNSLLIFNFQRLWRFPWSGRLPRV